MAAAQFSRDRLRGHRNGTGYTRAQVAVHIGRTEAAVKSYEAGTAEPPARVLAALAELFGVPVDDFYQQREDPVADYAGAVATHCRPLTDAELDAVAVVLRKINRRRRAAAAAADPDSGPDAA